MRILKVLGMVLAFGLFQSPLKAETAKPAKNQASATQTSLTCYQGFPKRVVSDVHFQSQGCGTMDGCPTTVSVPDTLSAGARTVYSLSRVVNASRTGSGQCLYVSFQQNLSTGKIEVADGYLGCEPKKPATVLSGSSSEGGAQGE